jgi:hypothetical protein
MLVFWVNISGIKKQRLSLRVNFSESKNNDRILVNWQWNVEFSGKYW